MAFVISVNGNPNGKGLEEKGARNGSSPIPPVASPVNGISSTSRQRPNSVYNWKPGTEVTAKFAFQKAAEEDLPFEKNEKLTIIAASKVRLKLIQHHF